MLSQRAEYVDIIKALAWWYEGGKAVSLIYAKQFSVIVLIASVIYLLLGCNDTANITIERSIDKFNLSKEFEKILLAIGADKRDSSIEALIIIAVDNSIDSFQISLLAQKNGQKTGYIAVLGRDYKLNIARTNIKGQFDRGILNLTFRDLAESVGKKSLLDLCVGQRTERINFRLETALPGEILINTKRQKIFKLSGGRIINTGKDEQIIITRQGSKLLINDRSVLNVFVIGSNTVD